MKQLARIQTALYGTPWAILPQAHAELGSLYRNYINGRLPAMAPEAMAPEGQLYCGITYQADHAQGLAIVYLSGVVVKRVPRMLCGPSLIDLAQLDTLLDDIAADDAIQTVVFDFDTPGGMIVGLEETAGRIRDLSATKRTVAYCDMQCCSAGYYLAAACDEFYAARSAMIGSIGTYIAALDDSREWEMEGLELVLAKSGDLKAMGHPGKPWTADERAWLQNKADTVGAEFRNWVTERRPGIEESTMQGQYFFAKENPAGLVDGFYRDLPALLAELMQPV